MYSMEVILEEIYRLHPDYRGVIEDFVDLHYEDWVTNTLDYISFGPNSLEELASIFIDEFGET